MQALAYDNSMGRERDCPGADGHSKVSGLRGWRRKQPLTRPAFFLSPRQRAAFRALTFAICALPFDLSLVSTSLL